MESPHPLRKLDELDHELSTHSGYTNGARWMIPYADFLTLLLGFFIVMYAMVQKDNMRLHEVAQKNQHVASTAVKKVKLARQDLEHLKLKLVAQGKDPDSMLREARSQQTSATMQQLERSLSEEFDANSQQFTLTQDKRGLVISFQDRIFFQPGSATLSPQAQHTLDKLSTVLMKTPHPIRVEGHTDNTPIHTPNFPSNWELSTARATSIIKNLIEKHRFPPQRLSAAGFGEFYPLRNNSTIEGKQKNRRVDIVLLNPLSDLSDTQEGKVPSQKAPRKE